MDDFTTVDVVIANGSGQQFTQKVVQLFGGALSPGKFTCWRSQRVMLGVHIRMDRILTKGIITFEPRADTIAKIVEASQQHLSLGSLTPADASKLRGMGSWCSGDTFGRAGRLGLSQLKARQYDSELNDFSLTPALKGGLEFLTTVLPKLRPRDVQVFGKLSKPVVVYSDASWPENVSCEEALESSIPPRIGWVIFRPGEIPVGFTLLIDQCFLSMLLQRKTQIFAAETIVGLIVPLLCPELVRGRDVTWFIDNEAAVSSLIRGTSRSEDVGHIAAAAQLAMMAVGARVWYEWVDTKSNPSDGLSRGGLSDPWTLQRNWLLQEFWASDMLLVKSFLTRPDVKAAAC